MILIANDPINETHEFTNQFALFPIGSGRENPGERPTSRLSREQIDAFLNAEFDNARNAHFFVPPAEPAAATPEKGLARGVLKQAARDLRRFHSATRGGKRERHRDAVSWLHVFERDMKTPCIRLGERLRHAWRSLVRATNRNHDPFLVYSMASFNFGGGWRELLLNAENT